KKEKTLLLTLAKLSSRETYDPAITAYPITQPLSKTPLLAKFLILFSHMPWSSPLINNDSFQDSLPLNLYS
ncbi:MAG TPA: hypothetical protein VFX43_04785, partial [Chitinophagaceae bacterium]|nr:hypothetical protein [Chitinophagaceae bacterium]